MNNWTNRKTNKEILQLNRSERLGQCSKSKYGLPMTIVVYRNADDIDVEIDGTIVKHKSYKNFKLGNICKTSSDYKITRVGETSTNSDGLKMTIIEYRLATDIDIKFDDGTILKHKDYYAFKKGKYKNPNYIKPTIEKPKKEKIDRTGETIKAKNGMIMTIIAYRTRKDIDIQFEDGTIVTNKRYQHFITGEINNPNITGTIQENQKKLSRVGEKVITSDGIELVLINYRNRKDIDIQLPDGSILTHRKYEKFKAGSINCSEYIKKIRLNETIINADGQKMIIIAYRNSRDIDVQFEDGTILEHTYYNGFKDGSIKYPKERLGETRINRNGQSMTITKYNSASDITVEFEDGYIVEHIPYRRFAELGVYHPMPYMLGDIQVEQRAYKFGEERNFFYICKKCHHHDIGTIDDINTHVCKEIANEEN